MPPKQARSRCGLAKKNALVDVLAAYFTTPVKVNYKSFGAQVHTAKVQRKELRVHAALLQALMKLQKNLSFAPMMMKDALLEVAKRNETKWRFTGTDADEFSCAVGVRLRCMCRHVTQAMCKPRPPQWVVDLFTTSDMPALQDAAGGTYGADGADGPDGGGADGADGADGAIDAGGADGADGVGGADGADAFDGADGAGGADGADGADGDGGDGGADGADGADGDEAGGGDGADGAEAADEDDCEIAYFVGWDAEHKVAHRQLNEESEKEYTKSFQAPTGAKESDAMIAIWPDGYRHRLAALTVAQWKSMLDTQAEHKKTRSVPPLWASEDGLMEVRVKADRNTSLVWLRVISEDGDAKQRCQISVKNVLSEADAVDCMILVAEAVANGDVNIDDVYEKRNEVMQAYYTTHPDAPGAQTKTGLRKRPAVADIVDVAEGEPNPVTPQPKRRLFGKTPRAKTFDIDEEFPIDELRGMDDETQWTTP